MPSTLFICSSLNLLSFGIKVAFKVSEVLSGHSWNWESANIVSSSPGTGQR